MTTNAQIAREFDTLATERPDLFRSAATQARAMGSARATYIEDRGSVVLRATVIRTNGTWRVARCGCTHQPCQRCAALFVGLNPGITFPSKHTEDDWNDAHAELVRRAIPVDYTPGNESCRVCGIRGGEHTASCDYQPVQSSYYDDI